MAKKPPGDWDQTRELKTKVSQRFPWFTRLHSVSRENNAKRWEHPGELKQKKRERVLESVQQPVRDTVGTRRGGRRRNRREKKPDGDDEKYNANCTVDGLIDLFLWPFLFVFVRLFLFACRGKFQVQQTCLGLSCFTWFSFLLASAEYGKFNRQVIVVQNF